MSKTVAPVEVRTPVDGPNCQIWKWLDIDAGDTITPLVVGFATDITVVFIKGSAFGGNMSLPGTCDPDPLTASYVTLKDGSYTAISGISADAIRDVAEAVYAIAPAAASGAAGVNVWAKLSNRRGT